MLEPSEVATVQFKPHARWKMNVTAVISHMGTRPETELGKQPDPGISRYPAHKSETYKGKLVTEHMSMCWYQGKQSSQQLPPTRGKGDILLGN